jgi:hypothetical protein
MTASAIVKAMAKDAEKARLHTQYMDGKAAYWLDDGKGRCVRVPYREGKQVAESSLVEPCEPGLFPGFPQSWKLRQREGA